MISCARRARHRSSGSISIARVRAATRALRDSSLKLLELQIPEERQRITTQRTLRKRTPSADHAGVLHSVLLIPIQISGSVAAFDLFLYGPVRPIPGFGCGLRSRVPWCIIRFLFYFILFDSLLFSLSSSALTVVNRVSLHGTTQSYLDDRNRLKRSTAFVFCGFSSSDLS